MVDKRHGTEYSSSDSCDQSFLVGFGMRKPSKIRAQGPGRKLGQSFSNPRNWTQVGKDRRLMRRPKRQTRGLLRLSAGHEKPRRSAEEVACIGCVQWNASQEAVHSDNGRVIIVVSFVFLVAHSEVATRSFRRDKKRGSKEFDFA